MKKLIPLFILLFISTIAKPQEYATLPFEDNFETESLSENWLAKTDVNNDGFVEVVAEWGIEESFGLAIGKSSDGELSTNSADLHLNLEGKSDVFLSFSMRYFHEENHIKDGLYFSDNGGESFEQVYTFKPEDWCGNVWGEFPPFSIDELAKSAELELTDKFVIRFQQYDDSNFDSWGDEDGLILDEINVYSRTPHYVTTFPFEDNFDDGSTKLGASWSWEHADKTIFPIENTVKPTGKVEIVYGEGIGGSYGLMLGKTCEDGLTSNALDLHLNLKDKEDIFLSFSIRSFHEENHAKDGLYFSDNGGESFEQVYTFKPEDWCGNVWGEFPPFNVDELAKLKELALTDKFVIRFQQFDDADFNTWGDEDGFILDDVKVHSHSPEYANLPFCDDFDDGTGILDANWRWAHADKSIFPIEGTIKPTGFVGIVYEEGVNDTYGLMLGKTCEDGLTSNALDLHLNLKDKTGVFLSFAMRDFYDEKHAQDGIFFSNNGGESFEKIHQFKFEEIPDNIFIDYILNLDSLVSPSDLDYTNKSIIRFQQYDDTDFDTWGDEDGLILDNVNVHESGLECGVVRLKDYSDNSNINIYPNPFENQLNIESNELNGQEVEIEILDITGKRVYYKSVKLVENYKISTIDIPSGLLILNLRTANKNYTKKVYKN